MDVQTTRRTTVLFVLAAAASVVTACSDRPNVDPGLEPGADGIRAVITIYAGAIGDGDGPRACSLLHTEAQQALQQRVGTESCLTAVESLGAGLSADAADSLESLEVSGISGEATEQAEATISSDSPGADEAIAALGGSLVRMSVVDERWGISAFE